MYPGKSRMEKQKIDEKIDIQSYMTHGVESIVAGALKSPLFAALREGGLLTDDHAGGCVLYEKRSEVEAYLHT